MCFQGDACLDQVAIVGTGSQHHYVVEVSRGTSGNFYNCVDMRHVTVSGARFAAVGVIGAGSELVAFSSSMHSSKRGGLFTYGGRGLYVAEGGHASLERGCRADGNQAYGWEVTGSGSSLCAYDSSASKNVYSNVYIHHGGTAHIVRCTMDDSERGCGLLVESARQVEVDDSSICANKKTIVGANSSPVMLSRCRCDRDR